MAVNIDQSYYRSGTATVDAAGTVVTGQGTQWVSATRANDLFGTHTGDGVRILSVDSDTQLTLAYPWSGPAQVASDYEIQFTPYDTGYYPAVRNLLQTMTSGNVEALAGLAGVPDGVPVFTGAGTMEIQGKDTFATPDPNGNLADLSGLPNVDNLAELSGLPNVDNLIDLSSLILAARQILQTDETGALKAIELAANKFLRTDVNGDLALSDLGEAAIALLNMAGVPEANKLPFLSGANGASLTDFTALARTLLASATGSDMWDAMGGASSLGTNGWIRFPNGLILQWGRSTLDGVGAFNPQVLGGVTYYTHFYYITLPIPFPNAFYSVTGSNLGWSPQNQGSMAGKTLNVGKEGSDLTRFALSFSAPQTGDAPHVGWIAVGR